MDSKLTWQQGKRVAIIGAGPGGVSAALAFLRQGFDVRLFEKHAAPQPLGGAVLLSSPVLAILRDYGIDPDYFGPHTIVEFRNKQGKVRARLPFNEAVEKSLGIAGWHRGVLRSNAFARMMDLLPDGALVANHGFESCAESGDGIKVRFSNGDEIEADVLVGADGIRSRVAAQVLDPPGLFHVGLRVWLAWCDADDIDDVPSALGAITHGRRYQASFFPMLHDGRPGYEWWVVEPVRENEPLPQDVRGYLENILRGWHDPLPRFPAATDFDTQIFPWDIYNRPSLDTWSAGRVVCIGDAVHPVSPYAAYGMGMAIEDGYFLARELAGRDLADAASVAEGFAAFEQVRVNYTNHHVEFARKLGNIFHGLPGPLAAIRDLVFDRTPLLGRMIERDYLRDQEAMSLSLEELHVTRR